MFFFLIWWDSQHKQGSGFLSFLEAFDRMSGSNDDMKDNLAWKCLRKLSSKTKERHKNTFSLFITPAWYMQHMEKYWEDYYPCKRRLTVLALFCASLFYIFMKNCSFFGNFCLFCERFDNLYQRFCRFYFSNESPYLFQVFLNTNSLFMSFFNENSSATITLIHQRNLMFCRRKKTWNSFRD